MPRVVYTRVYASLCICPGTHPGMYHPVHTPGTPPCTPGDVTRAATLPGRPTAGQEGPGLCSEINYPRAGLLRARARRSV